MKKLNFLLLFFIALFAISQIGVKGQGTGVYNIVTNPSEDMSTSIHINYHADIKGTFVEYTLASDTNYQNKKEAFGECELWSRPDNENGWNSSGFYERYVCRVELTNLKPNTSYRYRVGKDTFSEDFLFKTAGQDSFSFVHLTDPQFATQPDSEVFNNLLTKALSINPDISFALFSGDAVDKGGRADLWNMFFNASNMRKIPFAMAVGNHEYYDTGVNMTNNNYFVSHYFNPQNGPEELLGSTYYFKYNNALFFVIDTEVRTYVPQTQWFKDVMAKEQAQYVIVSMHRSFYGSQYSDHSSIVRNTWQKTFEEYGVDLVLSGHDHVYARSKLLYQNVETDDIYKGITYIIGGSSGKKFYPLKKSESEKYYAKGIANTSVVNILTVDEEKISLNLIDLNGNTLDTHEIMAKRPAKVEGEFSKKSFLDSVKVEQDIDNFRRLNVTWPSAYGNVLSVNVSDGRSDYLRVLATEKVTDQTVILSAGKIYDIKVQVNFKDGTSESKDFEINTKMPFGTIDNLKVDKVKKNTAQISWESDLINKQLKKYEIYLDDSLIEELESDQLSYTFKNLTKNTTYKVTIKGIDIYDDVIYTDELEFVTPAGGCASKNASYFGLPLLGLLFFRRRRFFI